MIPEIVSSHHANMHTLTERNTFKHTHTCMWKNCLYIQFKSCANHVLTAESEPTPAQCNDSDLLLSESLYTGPMDTEDNCILNKFKPVLRREVLWFLPSLWTSILSRSLDSFHQLWETLNRAFFLEPQKHLSSWGFSLWQISGSQSMKTSTMFNATIPGYESLTFTPVPNYSGF